MILVGTPEPVRRVQPVGCRGVRTQGEEFRWLQGRESRKGRPRETRNEREERKGGTDEIIKEMGHVIG